MKRMIVVLFFFLVGSIGIANTQTIIFSDDFESGTTNPEWTTMSNIYVEKVKLDNRRSYVASVTNGIGNSSFNQASCKGEKSKNTDIENYKTDKEFKNLPLLIQKKISKHLNRSAYEITESNVILSKGKSSKFKANNPMQNLNAYFNNKGIYLYSNSNNGNDWSLEMSISKLGRDRGLKLELPQVDPIKTADRRIEYQRGIVTEWYLNEEHGVEQGVTINTPPVGDSNVPLIVEWSVSGSLLPSINHEGTVITFNNKEQTEILHYGEIKAWDAKGRSLQVKLALQTDEINDHNTRIAYIVNDRGAIYPITIDPIFSLTKQLEITLSSLQPEYFGGNCWSVAKDNDIVVLGVPVVQSSADADMVFIFYRDFGGPNNWGLVKSITENWGDNFGISVSISNDVLVVGSAQDNENGENSGAAYVYYRNQGGVDNWGEIKKIIASDSLEEALFGWSVSLSEDIIVVGSPGNYNYGPSKGSTYIYHRNQGGLDNWGEVKKITSSDGASWNLFGNSVSINDETLIIGAYYNDDYDNVLGAAYIYNRNEGGYDNWGLVKKITASDCEQGNDFGFSVSIDNDTVVVGAPGDDEKGYNSGSAYIYYRDEGGPDNWGEIKKITASDGIENDLFGWSVSISGYNIAVGTMTSIGGAAYIFHRNQYDVDGWHQAKRIAPIPEEDYFGFPVFLDGDILVIGAPFTDNSPSHGSSAYIFQQAIDNSYVWYDIARLPSRVNEGDGYLSGPVSISADTLVVGDPFYEAWEDPFEGVAYIFDRNREGFNQWGLVKKILPPEDSLALIFTCYGHYVSIDNDTVAIGATGIDTVFIYYRDEDGVNNWGEVKRIANLEGFSTNGNNCLTLYGDYLFVGTVNDLDYLEYQGSVHIYYRDEGGPDNWGEIKKLTASDGYDASFFGCSLSISNDTLIVGATDSVYIFYRNQGGVDNWGEIKKLTASDGIENDLFGWSVSISEDDAVVGSPWHNDQGAAYIFNRNDGGANNWGEVKKITASDGHNWDFFSYSVDINMDTIVIGSPMASNPDGHWTTYSGAVYIYYRYRGGSNAWGEIEKINCPYVDSYNYFGSSISLGNQGYSLVIAAPGIHGWSCSLIGCPTFLPYTYVFDDNQHDRDGDGIEDSEDICPAVDATGYDIDSDGCVDSIVSLISMIEHLSAEGTIPIELKTAILSIVIQAEESLQRESIQAAIGILRALIRLMNAQSGRLIDNVEANAVIEYSESVIAWLTSQLS